MMVVHRLLRYLIDDILSSAIFRRPHISIDHPSHDSLKAFASIQTVGIYVVDFNFNAVSTAYRDLFVHAVTSIDSLSFIDKLAYNIDPLSEFYAVC